eukprot:CAMPEP_0170508316 /NCGR_PEP_ID=MMETSP0208-20121228/61979_1 /TAXON_ID=197538 /ORGANISM="Strombidium inclinatum, Strain S3" /LENGTH=188 /DNA_ID=CAMNT_0010791137 /DNA_START=262 /DNA_END=825 /DNA_ORIENTATION=+
MRVLGATAQYEEVGLHLLEVLGVYFDLRHHAPELVQDFSRSLDVVEVVLLLELGDDLFLERHPVDEGLTRRGLLCQGGDLLLERLQTLARLGVEKRQESLPQKFIRVDLVNGVLVFVLEHPLEDAQLRQVVQRTSRQKASDGVLVDHEHAVGLQTGVLDESLRDEEGPVGLSNEHDSLHLLILALGDW